MPSIEVTNHLSSSAGVGLKQAILLYQNEDKSAATLNPIAYDPRRKRNVIGPGRTLEGSAFAKITKELAGTPNTKRRELLDAGLLLTDNDLMVWYRPSVRRTILFKTRNNTVLDDLSGKPALHPALLFMARSNGLYVFALGSDERPTLETKLFRAPYFNVYASGHMCQGDYRLPDNVRPDSLPHWEKAFFDTNFSHTNMGNDAITSHVKGHQGLWVDATREGRGALKVFPVEWLLPLTETYEVTAPKGKKGKLLTLGKAVSS